MGLDGAGSNRLRPIFNLKRHHFGGFGRSLQGYSRVGNSGKRKHISASLQYDYSYKMYGFFGKKNTIHAGLSCYLWKGPESTIVTSI